MERASNSAIVDFEESPILYAIDIALRGWEGFGKFIRVPERHVKKFYHLLEKLQAAEQAEGGK